MIINIERLSNHPECIDSVVHWMHEEWGKDNINFWDSWIRSSMGNSDIPQTYIIFVDGKLAGTYSIWRCDLQSRQDLFPWFGGLYVDKEFRGKLFNGKKLGEYMLEDAIKKLRKAHVKQAYLFTEKTVDYYVRNGWEYIGVAPDEDGNEVKLCVYNLKHRKSKCKGDKI